MKPDVAISEGCIRSKNLTKNRFPAFKDTVFLF
jgi:hypothetical protein